MGRPSQEKLYEYRLGIVTFISASARVRSSSSAPLAAKRSATSRSNIIMVHRQVIELIQCGGYDFFQIITVHDVDIRTARQSPQRLFGRMHLKSCPRQILTVLPRVRVHDDIDTGTRPLHEQGESHAL